MTGVTGVTGGEVAWLGKRKGEDERESRAHTLKVGIPRIGDNEVVRVIRSLRSQVWRGRTHQPGKKKKNTEEGQEKGERNRKK